MRAAARKGATPSRSVRPERRAWDRRLILVPVVVVAMAAIASVLAPRLGESQGPAAWARLGTEDVHALQFMSGSTERLLFGHHGGLLVTEDGGRTWAPGTAAADAMSLSTTGEDRLVIAGHLVLQESRDGGRTWADIAADLPSLDIHAFAQSSTVPDRMWAWLASGGIHASEDGGLTWAEVHRGDVINLVAYADAGLDVLLGINPFVGVVRSKDGGRTWTPVGAPPVSPVTTIAATADGRSLVLGGPDGMHLSHDGGQSWRHVLRTDAVLAAAVSDDARVLGAVSEDTTYYRSDDGGATWPGPD